MFKNDHRPEDLFNYCIFIEIGYKMESTLFTLKMCETNGIKRKRTRCKCGLRVDHQIEHTRVAHFCTPVHIGHVICRYRSCAP